MAATALTASYVLYGFDTAGTLAEETHDPRKRLPVLSCRLFLPLDLPDYWYYFCLDGSAGFGYAGFGKYKRRITYVGEISSG